MRTHVYTAICEHIDGLTANRQEKNALFLIFSELLQGNELGIEYLVRQYGTYARDTLGRHKMNDLLLMLREQGLIEVDIWGNRFERRAHHYRLTAKAYSLIQQSSTAYWTYADYLRRRNAQQIWDPVHQASSWEPAGSYLDLWFQMLPNTPESNDFLAGLLDLESRDLVFRRLEATREQIAVLDRFIQLRNIPNMEFKPRYRPLSSGRLQSVPHLFLGKELVPYIRPASDPFLEHGFLFSLDYSKEELRILASMLDSSSPFRQWADDPNNGFEDLLNIYGINIPPKLWKGFMYSFLYGSEGYALGKDLGYDEAIAMGYYSNYDAGRQIVREFKQKVPEVDELRNHFSEVFTSEHAITAPGGVVRPVDPHKDLTKRGTIKKNRARQIPLSHIIQGTGAYMARTLIARARHLKHAQLHIPIHDGFVFYCSKGSFHEAYREAEELLNSVARDIVPQVEIPHKREWMIGVDQNA